MANKIISLVLCAVSVIILCVVYRVIKMLPSEEMGGPRARAIGIVGIFALLGTVVFFFQFICAVAGKTFFELKRYGMPIWVLLLIGIVWITVLVIILLKNMPQ